MKRYIPLVLDTIAMVAFALWLGGLAACWLALSPAAHDASPEAVPAAQSVFAEMLRRFSAIAESCGVILAAVQWVLRRRYQQNQSLFVADGVRMVAMFIALFAAEYGRYVLIPTLIKTHSSAAVGALAGFAIVQAVLLVSYLGITAWLQSPRPSVIMPALAQPSPNLVPNGATPQPAKTANMRRQKR